MQIAREGANTDVTHLRAFSPERRYATLVAGALDAMTVLTDETLEMHERFLGRQFKKAERKHLGKFQENGKAINDALKRYASLGRALIDAKTQNADPFAAVEAVLPWNDLTASVAAAEKLAQPGEFDSLALMTNSYPVLRRYAPQFIAAFEFRSAPASEQLMKAVELLRELNKTAARKVPDDAPRGFVRPRWERHVVTSPGGKRSLACPARFRRWGIEEVTRFRHWLNQPRGTIGSGPASRWFGSSAFISQFSRRRQQRAA